MKKQMFKRLSALFLCVLLVVSAVSCSGAGESSSAAGNSKTESSKTESSKTQSKEESSQTEGKMYYNAEGYPICDEIITVKSAGGENSPNWQPQYNTMLETKKIEELFGIKMEYETYVSDAWQTQLTTMIASQNLPDLLMRGGLGTKAAEYGMDGILAPWSDYIDLMPNLQALFDADPTAKMEMSAADGNVYSLCMYVADWYGLNRQASIYVDNSWLERVDKEVPKTTDEFLDMLRAFKAEDANGNGDVNDEIPLGVFDNWTSRYIRRILGASYGFFCYGESGDSAKLDFSIMDDGTIILVNTLDNYKEYLKYCHQLYEEGLVDQELYTMTSAQFSEKNSSGVYGAISCNLMNSSNDVSMITGLTSDYNNTRNVVMVSAVADAGNYCMCANSEYKEAIARLFDYFLNKDNRYEFYQDIEWIETPCSVPGYENILVNDTAALGKKLGIAVGEWEQYREELHDMRNGFKTLFRAVNGDGEVLETLSYEEVIAAKKAFTEAHPDMSNREYATYEALKAPGLEFKNAYPTLPYAANVIAERNDLCIAIGSYIGNARAQFIIGEMDIDKEFDNFKAQLDAMGLQRLLQIEQETYNATIGK